jgi:hypothetical protein
MLRLCATLISSLSYVMDGAGDGDALRFAIAACAVHFRRMNVGSEPQGLSREQVKLERRVLGDARRDRV